MCRYANQNIHELRGLKRPLTEFEKLCFAQAIGEHMEVEFKPQPTGQGGG